MMKKWAKEVLLFLTEFVHKALGGWRLYRSKNGQSIAAASTFFAIICFFPILLLLLALSGALMGDYYLAHQELLNTLKGVFPHINPWVWETIKKVLVIQLEQKRLMGWLNFALLVWASLGFIRSFFYGVSQIATEEKSRHHFVGIKSIFILLITAVFVSSLIGLPPLILSTMGNANLLRTIFKNFWPHYFFLLIYFSFLFRYIFKRSIQLKDGFYGALSFLLLFLLGKNIFWVYLKNLRHILILNFGDFYALMVFILWAHFLIASFFFSACVSFAPRKIISSGDRRQGERDIMKRIQKLVKSDYPS